MKVANGTYAPSGGITLGVIDTHPLTIGRYPVTAKIEDGWATGYAGEHRIFRKRLPVRTVRSYKDVYTWIAELTKDCAIVAITDSAVQDDGHGCVHVDITVAKGSKAKNFGQKAATAARKASGGLPVRRVSSGGCSTAEFDQYSYVYYF